MSRTDALRGRGSRDQWQTPPEVFAWASDTLGPFDIDVCANDHNHQCEAWITPEIDALGVGVRWNGRAWMNPPYSCIGPWAAKARYEATLGATVVGLVPVAPDTRWWQDHVAGSAEVIYIPRRIVFVGATSNAPFPCCFVVWRPPFPARRRIAQAQPGLGL